jgi:hypothetical protein
MKVAKFSEVFVKKRNQGSALILFAIVANCVLFFGSMIWATSDVLDRGELGSVLSQKFSQVAKINNRR